MATSKLPVVHDNDRAWSYRQVLHTPALWIMLLSAVGASAAFSTFIAHGPIHLRDLGHPLRSGAIAISTMTIASLLAKSVVAIFGDRVDLKYLWALFSVICGAGMLLALNAHSEFSVYVVAACIGSGFGAMLVCMMSQLGVYFGIKAYASLVGLAIAVQTTASAAIPYLVGAAYDKWGSYAIPFRAIALYCFLGALALLFVRAPSRRQRTRGAPFLRPAGEDTIAGQVVAGR